jgi:hypothetical protein
MRETLAGNATRGEGNPASERNVTSPRIVFRKAALFAGVKSKGANVLVSPPLLLTFQFVSGSRA